MNSENFKKALENCASEPIHLPGAIQPFGVLLAFEGAELKLNYCSENAVELWGVPAKDLLNQPCKRFFEANLLEWINSQTAGTADFSADEPFRFSTNFGPVRLWDAFLHRNQGQLILELERVNQSQSTVTVNPNLHTRLRRSLSKLDAAPSLQVLCETAVVAVKELTGLDNVMVYQFHEDYHGEVIAEAKETSFAGFLGQHFPASDIPKQARDVFLANWIRMIPDRAYSAVPVLGLHPTPLNLGRSLLRSVSPIHVEYLKNMGVQSSLTISLIREGKLWGLITGHHYRTAQHLDHAIRSACETVGRLVSSLLTVKIELQQQTERDRLRLIQGALLRSMQKEPNLLNGLISHSPNLLDLAAPSPATNVEEPLSAAGYFEGTWATLGLTPSPTELQELVKWLSTEHAETIVFHSDCLSLHYPPSVKFKDVASGILALRIPKGVNNYIIWFKPEVVQVVSWAGQIEKNISTIDGTLRLHPRASFAEWKQLISLKSLPWLNCEIEFAQELRHSITAVDLQRQFVREQQARAEAERADKQKEELLEVVSHDLRNPLNSLKLSIGLIEKTLQPEAFSKIRTIFMGIKRSVERMNHLIDDLLSIAKLESGNVLLESEFHPTSVILQDIFDLLLPIASEKGVRLMMDFNQDTECFAYCDRERILQVLSNLIGNAIKFTPKDGNIRVKVEQIGTDAVFSVADTGPGIPAESIEFIFDRFWQARQTQRMGTGLGLSIAKGIVEAHEGRIWATSQLGKGSTFYFIIPSPSHIMRKP